MTEQKSAIDFGEPYLNDGDEIMDILVDREKIGTAIEISIGWVVADVETEKRAIFKENRKAIDVLLKFHTQKIRTQKHQAKIAKLLQCD
jgi:hypothetical protein